MQIVFDRSLYCLRCPRSVSPRVDLLTRVGVLGNVTIVDVDLRTAQFPQVPLVYPVLQGIAATWDQGNARIDTDVGQRRIMSPDRLCEILEELNIRRPLQADDHLDPVVLEIGEDAKIVRNGLQYAFPKL